jgi:DNA-binding sugar fermentation-stimulating protein
MVRESKNIYSIIDTQLQMKCFEIALEKGYISWLSCPNSLCQVRNCPHRAKILKRNFRINHSLIDYLIEHKNKKYLLEIKSAVMKYKNFAMYPDCPSIRGQKHIKELIDIQSARITDRINYPNEKPNKLPESSDRIESTRITRPNNIYPNEGPNNIPEYRPNNYNIYPNNNRMIYPNNRPNKNKIFGEHSSNPFGPYSGSDIKFGPRSGKIFGQNSGKVFGEYSGNSFGSHSGSDIKFGQDSGSDIEFGPHSSNKNIFGQNSGKVFGPNSGKAFGEHSGNTLGNNSGNKNIFGQNSDNEFGENSGNLFDQNSGSKNTFGHNSGKLFDQDSGRNINPRLSVLYPYKSVVLFIAGMKNISAFSPNKNADPKIYELLKIAKNKGVKIKAIQIYFDEKRKSVVLKNDDLPVIL